MPKPKLDLKVQLVSATTGRRISGASAASWAQRNIAQVAQGLADFITDIAETGAELWRDNILTVSPASSEATRLLHEGHSGRALLWTRTYHDSISTSRISARRIKSEFLTKRRSQIEVGPGFRGRVVHPVSGTDIQVVAMINEQGATIPVTASVRAFFHARGVRLKKNTIRIPARPVMRQAANQVLKMANAIFARHLNTMIAQVTTL